MLLVAISVCVGLAVVLLAMVSGRVLEERHALWWIAATIGAMMLSVAPVRQSLARWTRVDEPVVVCAACLACLAVLLLAAYANLARLAAQSRTLAQRVALLEESLEGGASKESAR